MSGQQLLQRADLQPEHSTRLFDGERGSDQFFSAHVLGLLRREQAALVDAGAVAALALDDPKELHSRFASDALQFIFRRPSNRRLVSSNFLG